MLQCCRTMYRTWAHQTTTESSLVSSLYLEQRCPWAHYASSGTNTLIFSNRLQKASHTLAYLLSRVCCQFHIRLHKASTIAGPSKGIHAHTLDKTSTHANSHHPYKQGKLYKLIVNWHLCNHLIFYPYFMYFISRHRGSKATPRVAVTSWASGWYFCVHLLPRPTFCFTTNLQ